VELGFNECVLMLNEKTLGNLRLGLGINEIEGFDGIFQLFSVIS